MTADHLLNLIARAAELRARGESWEQVAAKVGRDRETVRHWPIRYPEEWNRYFRAAEDGVILDAASRARGFLQLLLEADDLKIGCAAARALLKYRHDQIRAEQLQTQKQDKPKRGRSSSDDDQNDEDDISAEEVEERVLAMARGIERDSELKAEAARSKEASAG
jgi:hypothetical protein